jgi:AcrR family transcriptional regulator
MAHRARTIPRKKPSQERSKATVDAILAATARVLVRDGYDRASTNRVALAAGVSVGSLYQYFPSKEALVAGLIERHSAEMIAVLEAQFEAFADAPLEVGAREIVGAMLAAHAVDPSLHRVLIEQVPRIGRLERVSDFERRTAELLRAALERRREELRPKNLDLAVFVVVHAVEAITHAAVLTRPETLRDTALRDEIAALVLRYLTPG